MLMRASISWLLQMNNYLTNVFFFLFKVFNSALWSLIKYVSDKKMPYKYKFAFRSFTLDFKCTDVLENDSLSSGTVLVLVKTSNIFWRELVLHQSWLNNKDSFLMRYSSFLLLAECMKLFSETLLRIEV